MLRAGFEPARGDPIRFQVQRLNYSAIAAYEANLLLEKLYFQIHSKKLFFSRRDLLFSLLRSLCKLFHSTKSTTLPLRVELHNKNCLLLIIPEHFEVNISVR